MPLIATPMRPTKQRALLDSPLLQDTTLPPLLRNIYAARGVQSTTQLDNTLSRLLPFDTLAHIQAATALLTDVLQKQQHIMIVGDFDADGATSTTVAVRCLYGFGAKHVSYLVPNRFEYGYGLTPEITAVAARQKPDLIITVDNGISSIEGVAHAKSLGMRVLITDHHLPAQSLPKADVIINPNLPEDTFPSKCLAGVGVIFYVMLALRSHLRHIGWFSTKKMAAPNMAHLLDLVALGTVADVVPLDHNNRILVQQGLARIKKGKHCPGIAALLQVAQRKHKQITASDLGFAIAPRLNAAGRLADMSYGIACLLSPTVEAAYPLAQKLDSLNKERRTIEQSMQQSAQGILENLYPTPPLPDGICIYDAKWHQGVVGILAARVKEKVNRPVIAFTKVSDSALKGSARSIAGLHIKDVLGEIAALHPNLLLKFGGHAMAAGLSIPVSQYAHFPKIFHQVVSSKMTQVMREPCTITDGPLDDTVLNLELAEMLETLGPWGQGFPEPVFDNHFYVHKQHLLKRKHLKLSVSLHKAGYPIDAIAFFVDTEKWPNFKVEKIQAVYRLSVNVYGDMRRLQLIITDFQSVDIN